MFDQVGQSRLPQVQSFIQAISSNPCNPEGNIGILSQDVCILLINVGLHPGVMCSDVGKNILGQVRGRCQLTKRGMKTSSAAFKRMKHPHQAAAQITPVSPAFSPALA